MGDQCCLSWLPGEYFNHQAVGSNNCGHASASLREGLPLICWPRDEAWGRLTLGLQLGPLCLLERAPAWQMSYAFLWRAFKWILKSSFSWAWIALFLGKGEAEEGDNQWGEYKVERPHTYFSCVPQQQWQWWSCARSTEMWGAAAEVAFQQAGGMPAQLSWSNCWHSGASHELGHISKKGAPSCHLGWGTKTFLSLCPQPHHVLLSVLGGSLLRVLGWARPHFKALVSCTEWEACGPHLGIRFQVDVPKMCSPAWRLFLELSPRLCSLCYGFAQRMLAYSSSAMQIVSC